MGGELRIPGSKHYTQRLILLSAFSNIPVTMENISNSMDEEIAAGIARSCGSSVSSTGLRMAIKPSFESPDEVYCGESATSARIVISLLCRSRSRTFVRMDKSLIRRSFGPLISALERTGCRFHMHEDGIFVDGSGYVPAYLEVDGSISSQFVSSLLMMTALDGNNGMGLKVKGRMVSAGYIDLTIDCLSKFGVRTLRRGNELYLQGQMMPTEGSVIVETDMSSASFMVTLGVLASSGCVKIRDVISSGVQPDHSFIGMLSSAGYNVKYCLSERTILACKSMGESVTVDVDENPDLAPIASVLGIFSESGVLLKNTGRLVWKESDRRGEIIRLVRSFGAMVREDGNDLYIKRGEELKYPEKLIFNDHRMTMAAAIASISVGSPTTVGDLNSITKSYPSFLSHLNKLGIQVHDRSEN